MPTERNRRPFWLGLLKRCREIRHPRLRRLTPTLSSRLTRARCCSVRNRVRVAGLLQHLVRRHSLSSKVRNKWNHKSGELCKYLLKAIRNRVKILGCHNFCGM